MELTIITPVFRQHNLQIIANTIPDNITWLCVFDIMVSNNIPNKAKVLEVELVKSNWGVFKVNEALKMIKDGHIYILDDDTVLHENFDTLLSLNSGFDFIHFNQNTKEGRKRTGGEVKRGKIDIGNFIVSRELIGNTFLSEDDTMPDGLWAEQLYKKCKKPLYLNRTFSIYNYLR